MLAFLGSRLLRMTITLWAIVTAVFLATRLTGNPIDFLMPEGLDAASRAEMIAYWGLDRPVAEQYLLFWKSLLSGDFGLGLMERRPVAVIFGERLWQSASLLLATLALTVAVGVPLGILAALWRGQARGQGVLFVAFLGYAVPNFVLAILLLLIFSYTLHWLPSAGSATLLHYVMPTVALAAYFVAALTRYTRNAMLDVLSEDYMRTARAKGMATPRILAVHALKNAAVPIVTMVGIGLSSLLGGIVVTETVFAIPGIGRLMIDAIIRRDFPILQGVILVLSALYVLINLLIDLSYSLFDPRIRY